MKDTILGYRVLNLLNDPFRTNKTSIFISKTLGCFENTIYVLIKRLEKEGYVRKTIDPNSKRSTQINITRKGLEHLSDFKEEFFNVGYYARKIEIK